MKRVIGSFLLLLVGSVLVAQERGSIQGSVTDAGTGKPLAGANIIIQETGQGTSSDAQGVFSFADLQPGTYTLTVRYVGYTPTTQRIDIRAGAQTSITISLSPTAIPLPQVLVTATIARERETPATFSNMETEHLRRFYVAHDPPAVLAELPSIVSYSWEGNDIGYSFLNIRGFDQHRIAVMVNGIPQNDPEDHNVFWIDMPDLLAYTDNVQVQRGAGSAFYGPPAIGGSINIVTTPRGTSPRVSLSSALGFQEYGDRNETVLNTRRYALSVFSGLIDRPEARYQMFGNLSTIRSAGYRHLSWTDLRSYFLGVVRYDETMTTRVHLFGGPLDHGLAYYGIPKFHNNKQQRRTNYNFFVVDPTGSSLTFASPRKELERGTFFQPHYELLHEWRLNPSLTLHNTIFYIQGDGAFDYDGDWVWFDPNATQWMRRYVGYDSTQTPSLLLRGFVGNKQWGWLPRVEWDHHNGKLTVGGEVRIHRSLRWGSIAFATLYPANVTPDFRFYQYNGQKDMISLYANELYRLTPTTTVMANLQLAYNRYGIRNEKFLGTTFDVPYLFVNPRMGINHNFSEQMNAYLSLGYTSREPRLFHLYNGEQSWIGSKPEFEATLVNGAARYNFEKPLARPERLLDLEIGGGYQTSRYKLSAYLYWMEFFDEIIKSGQLDIFGRPVTGNAERTRHIGLELVGRIQLLSYLSIDGNVTISRNRLVEYKEFDPTVGGFVSLNGNPIAGFPDLLANARMTYAAENVVLSLWGRYVSAIYTDNKNLAHRRTDPYTVFDLDASYDVPFGSFATVTLRGKIRNLFNTLYLAGGDGDQFFPGAERNYFITLTFDF